MTTLRTRLGRCLQEERLRQGLTQARLAERADLSLKYLGEIERGEANVTVDALERLATALACDPWTLFAADGHRISKHLHALLHLELDAMRGRLVATLALLESLEHGGRLDDLSMPAPTLAVHEAGATTDNKTLRVGEAGPELSQKRL